MLTWVDFHHIPGPQNPADGLTKGFDSLEEFFGKRRLLVFILSAPSNQTPDSRRERGPCATLSLPLAASSTPPGFSTEIQSDKISARLKLKLNEHG